MRRMAYGGWVWLLAAVLACGESSPLQDGGLGDAGDGLDGGADGATDSGGPDAGAADDGGSSEPAWSLVRAVTLGSTCGVTNSGAMACWGYDWSTNDPPLEFGPPAPGDSAFGVAMRQIEGRPAILCGLSRDDRAYCWGNREDGVAPPLDGEPAVTLTVSVAACWLRTDRTATCQASELDQSTTEAQVPTDVEFDQISLGLRYGCGIRATSRTLECWGEDLFDVAGFEPEGEYTDLGTGNTHACAVDTDQNLVCWGAANVAASPRKPTEAVTEVAIEGTSTCARLASDGTWVCWNRETSELSRQLGEHTPSRSDIENVSVAPTHTCGETPDGWICWGANDAGQLDIPDPASVSAP